MPKKNFFKRKCAWSKVKDTLLGAYLVPYFQKILCTNRNTWYIDAFAGAGKFESGEDGSPLMALKLREERVKHSHVANAGDLIHMFFIEPEYTQQLRDNIGDAKNCEVIEGQSEEWLETLLHRCVGGNVFLYYDPFGVRTFDFGFLRKINNARFSSVEILMNFNAFGFFRDACRVMHQRVPYEEEFHEDEETPLENLSEELLNNRVGSDFWKDVVRSHGDGCINGYDAEKLIADGFVRNLRKIYKYVLSIPMRVPSGCPKYRMIHATRNMDGCFLMAENMQKRKTELDIGEQGEQQLEMFETCVEGKYVSSQDIWQWVDKLLSSNKEFRLTEFLSQLVCDNRLIGDFELVIDRLRYLESIGDIEVKRDPAKTKAGRESAFWEEKGNRQIVKLKKRCK